MTIDEAAERLHEEVFGPETPELIRRYYLDGTEPDRTYTGRYFGRLLPVESDDPGRFTAGDLASLALLGESVGGNPTLQLLRGGAGSASWQELLTEVPTDVHITKVAGRDLLRGHTVDGTPRPAAHRLWDEVLAIDGLSRTQVSLLLNLKRPKLLPIWTPVVESVIGSSAPWWSVVARFLEDEDTKLRFEALREEALAGTGVPGDQVTLLRLIDVILWMGHRAASRPIER